jgi:hypothetical protein
MHEDMGNNLPDAIHFYATETVRKFCLPICEGEEIDPHSAVCCSQFGQSHDETPQKGCENKK